MRPQISADRESGAAGEKKGREAWKEGLDRRRTKVSFFAGGEELQGFLEVLDGRADVLVLQGAAGVLAVLLGLGEVVWGEMNAAWREG